MSKQLPKILFVCYADSIHAQSWIRLLKDTSFDVRVFASPVPADITPPAWTFPTYSVVKPTPRPNMPRSYWLLPARGTLLRKVLTKLDRERLHLSEKWLRRVIARWRPDIVHTLRMWVEGEVSLKALRNIPSEGRPFWVVSSWGADIQWHVHMPEYRKNVIDILRICEGFTADCQSDLALAVSFGLSPQKIIPGAPFLATGGLDLKHFSQVRQRIPPSKRKIILVPKALESIHVKAVTVIEALRLAFEAGAIADVEIWLTMCSPAVRLWLSLMPEPFQKICHCLDSLPHTQFLELMSQARVMVAPSLVDGGPNVMWEAIAAGALPIMSPLDSIRDEVIIDGENGLLASALSCDQIAQAVIRAMTDDALVENAAQQNWKLIQARGDRKKIKSAVLAYYKMLVEGC